METERYIHAGLTIVLGVEEYDHEYADPRDCDNISTMVCWHPDYLLGDEQITDGSGRGAVKRDHHGSASTLFQTETGRTDFRDMRVIERYLRLARKAVVILPLYLLDHSGISMTAGSNTVGRGDTACGGTDAWGNARGWDTTMCGFIYTTAARIEELCGKPRRKRDEFYCPPDWKGTSRDWIVKQLENDVLYYDAYLRGSVYYWQVEDADGETLESCGCYLIATEEDEKHLKMEAEAEAKAIADGRKQERAEMIGAGFRVPMNVQAIIEYGRGGGEFLTAASVWQAGFEAGAERGEQP